jgi:anti-sigma factor RsiW
MTQPWDRAEGGPSPEELMAFADGELGPERAREVAAWLARHPDVGAEVRELHRFQDFWERSAPPEPAPATWARVLKGIEAAVPALRPAGRWKRYRPLWLSAAAAAALALVVLGRSLLTTVPPDGTGADEGPFPVAEAHEVDIISMDAHDADALVGHPAVLANLTFVTAADLGEVRVDPRPDGCGSRLEGGAVPMLVALPAGGKREP